MKTDDVDTSGAPQPNAGTTAVMTSESCVLTLRYALWHVGANALLVAGLAWAGETTIFFSAHIFGLFALLADFGVFYLHAGTRTFHTAAPLN